jgi:cellulose synthase/poly-beta-1,6-N-acetylglucosamine synthase-like glycosyltransferase
MIVALIPAHNEEDCISQTLTALFRQDLMPDRVIVIADNCSDRTAEIASAFSASVMVYQTVGNTHKKAGALNQVLEKILPEMQDDDLILVQDADSFLDPGFIAATVAKIQEGYAAAGGNFRAREGGGVCGWLQANEYARYARDNARKRGRVLCITGVGTMFTVRSLRAVVAAISDGTLPDTAGGYCYSYATLTEDNWMTLALKHLGMRFVAPMSATMSTEPMLTWGDLFRQRLRWKRGAVEDLKSYGLTRYTLKGWGLFTVSVIGILTTGIYLSTLAAAPWIGIRFQWWMLAITLIYSVERVATIKARGRPTQALAATVFPEWFYELFLQCVQVRALWDVIWRTKKNW